jgi:hypothetical protein
MRFKTNADVSLLLYVPFLRFPGRFKTKSFMSLDEVRQVVGRTAYQYSL